MTYPIHDAVAKVSATANPNIRHALDLIADKIEPVAPPPPPPTNAPAPPLRPDAYTLPSGATVCHTTADLKAALTGSAPIVLTDGEYDNATYLTNTKGLPIYSATLGGAVLRFGLVVGGNGAALNPRVQGATFGVHDPAKAFQGAALNLWGTSGAGATILDTFWDGGSTLPFGIYCLAPGGITFQRAKQTSPYLQTVWRLSDNKVGSGATMQAVTDLDGAGALTYNNGTTGVVLWLGHPVKVCARLKLGAGATASLETVNAFANTAVTDFELYGSPVGQYCEHFTRNCTHARYSIHDCAVGINGEWDDGVPGNAATHFCAWDGGTIATTKAGAYFDQGSEANKVTNTRFVGQSWAAVGAFRNTGAVDFATGNTYAMQAGAVELSAAHI